MEDKHKLGRKHSGIWNSLRDGDFDEEEIWDVLKNRSDYGSSGVRKFKEKDQSSSVPVPARPSAARMVPRSSNSGSNSSANSSNEAKLPPHEFIARRLARSQISSFSVLEGAGRTLKGRDLSKVRNAVLSKTGFLESL
ncbi:hypothetical protein ACSQ67_017654 [Phaseolus vulgaris]